MRWFAETHDPEHAAYWEVVGLLHDIDFEQFADEHCVKGFELLRGHDVDESIIRAAMSHGYGIAPGAPQPEHVMEKVLFATDELTGLIGAVALMRPSRSVMDLEVKSVLKKFKTHSFAAGCSRDVILQGAAMLGWELDELISQTILAMRAICES
ncbi:MAG: hydrolase [Coriobacteriales bacterium]|jgi:predicted hydrolase (HD superfamily)|nr:hydrolase [Coriobacteriales bacterium]